MQNKENYFKAYIFDLDQTLVDTKKALALRQQRRWEGVYEVIPEFSIYDGIQELLEYINDRNGVIAIVTSSPSYYAELVLEEFSITYHHLVGYHDTKKRKPDPAPVLKGIQLTGAKPEQCISIGDSLIDAIASSNAGIQFIGALWDCDPKGRTELISASDYSCDSPYDVKTLISNNLF